MNAQYRADVSKYQEKDAKTAILYWILLMVLYAIAGFAGRYVGALIPGIVLSVVLLVVCAAIALKKGGGFASIGFRKEGIKPSLVLGLLCGIVAVVLNKGILPAIVYGWKLEPVGFLATQFLYYLIGIALVEEVIFRGYIQTRLYGMIKNSMLAMSTGAFLFALMHVPFQVAIGNQVWGISLVIWLLTTIVWHFAFNLIFVRYNSIFGPILFHAMIDWSNDLFARDSSPMWTSYTFFGLAVCALIFIGIRTLATKIMKKKE